MDVLGGPDHRVTQRLAGVLDADSTVEYQTLGLDLEGEGFRRCQNPTAARDKNRCSLVSEVIGQVDARTDGQRHRCTVGDTAAPPMLAIQAIDHHADIVHRGGKDRTRPALSVRTNGVGPSRLGPAEIGWLRKDRRAVFEPEGPGSDIDSGLQGLIMR